MVNRLHIFEILKNGEVTLGKRILVVNLFYLVASIALAYSGIRISKDYVGITISALAIFTGFYFTLIVYVTDKTVTKINEIKNKGKEVSNLLKSFASDYKDFSKNLISQISYSIVLAILLIFVSILTQLVDINDCYCWKGFNLYEAFRFGITAIFLFLAGKMLHMILLIISNMQAFFTEELNRSNDKF